MKPSFPFQGHAHGRERWRIPLRHEPILTVDNQKLAIVQKSARAKFDFPKRNSAARLDRINEEPGDLNHTAILSRNRALMQGYFLADLRLIANSTTTFHPPNDSIFLSSF